jgi:hypothetical protein
LSGPYRLVARAIDLLDERRARRRREAFGRRRWLLSWHRDPDGRWRARLSGPEAPRTVERTSGTRVGAIARAAQAMERLLAFRAARSSDRPPDPTPQNRTRPDPA